MTTGHDRSDSLWRARVSRRSALQGSVIGVAGLAAAERLSAAGAAVHERVAMQLTGHRSRTIFDRYNIVQEAELHTASDRLCAYLSARPPARPAPPVTLGGVAGA